MRVRLTPKKASNILKGCASLLRTPQKKIRRNRKKMGNCQSTKGAANDTTTAAKPASAGAGDTNDSPDVKKDREEELPPSVPLRNTSSTSESEDGLGGSDAAGPSSSSSLSGGAPETEGRDETPIEASETAMVPVAFETSAWYVDDPPLLPQEQEEQHQQQHPEADDRPGEEPSCLSSTSPVSIDTPFSSDDDSDSTSTSSSSSSSDGSSIDSGDSSSSSSFFDDASSYFDDPSRATDRSSSKLAYSMSQSQYAEESIETEAVEEGAIVPVVAAGGMRNEEIATEGALVLASQAKEETRMVKMAANGRSSGSPTKKSEAKKKKGGGGRKSKKTSEKDQSREVAASSPFTEPLLPSTPGVKDVRSVEDEPAFDDARTHGKEEQEEVIVPFGRNPTTSVWALDDGLAIEATGDHGNDEEERPRALTSGKELAVSASSPAAAATDEGQREFLLPPTTTTTTTDESTPNDIPIEHAPDEEVAAATAAATARARATVNTTPTETAAEAAGFVVPASPTPSACASESMSMSSNKSRRSFRTSRHAAAQQAYATHRRTGSRSRPPGSESVPVVPPPPASPSPSAGRKPSATTAASAEGTDRAPPPHRTAASIGGSKSRTLSGNKDNGDESHAAPPLSGASTAERGRSASSSSNGSRFGTAQSRGRSVSEWKKQWEGRSASAGGGRARSTSRGRFKGGDRSGSSSGDRFGAERKQQWETLSGKFQSPPPQRRQQQPPPAADTVEGRHAPRPGQDRRGGDAGVDPSPSPSLPPKSPAEPSPLPTAKSPGAGGVFMPELKSREERRGGDGSGSGSSPDVAADGTTAGKGTYVNGEESRGGRSLFGRSSRGDAEGGGGNVGMPQVLSREQKSRRNFFGSTSEEESARAEPSKFFGSARAESSKFFGSASKEEISRVESSKFFWSTSKEESARAESSSGNGIGADVPQNNDSSGSHVQMPEVLGREERSARKMTRNDASKNPKTEEDEDAHAGTNGNPDQPSREQKLSAFRARYKKNAAAAATSGGDGSSGSMQMPDVMKRGQKSTSDRSKGAAGDIPPVSDQRSPTGKVPPLPENKKGRVRERAVISRNPGVKKASSGGCDSSGGAGPTGSSRAIVTAQTSAVVERPLPRRFTFDFGEEDEHSKSDGKKEALPSATEGKVAAKTAITLWQDKAITTANKKALVPKKSKRGGTRSEDSSGSIAAAPDNRNESPPDQNADAGKEASTIQGGEASHRGGGSPAAKMRSRSIPKYDHRRQPKHEGGNVAGAKIDRSSSAHTTSERSSRSGATQSRARADYGTSQRSFRVSLTKSANSIPTRPVPPPHMGEERRTISETAGQYPPPSSSGGGTERLGRSERSFNRRRGGGAHAVSTSPMSQRGRSADRGLGAHLRENDPLAAGGKSARRVRSTSVGSRTEVSSLGAGSAWGGESDEENSSAAGRTHNQNIFPKCYPSMSPESVAERRKVFQNPQGVDGGPPPSSNSWRGRAAAEPSPQRQKRIEQARKVIHHHKSSPAMPSAGGRRG